MGYGSNPNLWIQSFNGYITATKKPNFWAESNTKSHCTRTNRSSADNHIPQCDQFGETKRARIEPCAWHGANCQEWCGKGRQCSQEQTEWVWCDQEAQESVAEGGQFTEAGV